MMAPIDATTARTAQEFVNLLAERLSDPASVAEAIRAKPREGAGRAVVHWDPRALADGCPGMALFFGALQGYRPDAPNVAHAYLAAAISSECPSPTDSLFYGVPSVAFAARAVERRPGDYAELLSVADEQVAACAESLLSLDEPRVRSGIAGVPMPIYDVVSGLSGLGRYLLACGEGQRSLTERIMRHLVALTRPVVLRGHSVPGWWTPDSHPEGLFDVGLAHGISGPLALLSIAYEKGIRVQGHERAIRTIVEWLLARRGHDEHGPYWPATISTEHEISPSAAGPPARAGWCYGAPGVSRALFLASRALKEPQWCDAALDTLCSVLRRPPAQQYIHDATMCHGAAGLTRIVHLMARDAVGHAGSDELAAALPGCIANIVARAAPEHPFVWDSQGAWGEDGSYRSDERAHRPGYLDGAAGVALTLHACLEPDEDEAHGSLPWDAALLLR
ncbi:lanthionine synthetase C family protein [Pendulispora brunnea]|uniref:Lanthionine synthetase C family protein n=1 Tax=Pendulispora brunnea TaxID=2905690 RepID=A0ABZ2KE99_9BACT